ncbi:MAG: glycosyltransferase family 4 protein, partial [Thermosphaera sp.]
FKPISQNDLEKLISDELKQTCIEKDSINILCPKRMEKIYGIEYLLKAVKILIERKVKSFRLILIKWGTQTKHYRSLISQFNLSNNVIFLKPISRTAMPLLYNVSDFTVVPSLVEGFGLTVAESLACGRPVIGTAIGGILDQIVDGYNGFLVDPRSALNLADRMQILIEDDHLRKEMSVKAREFAESRLDLKNRVTNIIRLYKKIAE